MPEPPPYATPEEVSFPLSSKDSGSLLHAEQRREGVRRVEEDRGLRQAQPRVRHLQNALPPPALLSQADRWDHWTTSRRDCGTVRALGRRGEVWGDW